MVLDHRVRVRTVCALIDRERERDLVYRLANAFYMEREGGRKRGFFNYLFLLINNTCIICVPTVVVVMWCV